MPPVGKLAQQLQFGFDYKRYDNNLAFGGQSIFSSVTKVAQFLAIYDATLEDDYGQTAFENQVVFSPGKLMNGNNSTAFQASGVSQANATYAYDNLQLTRITPLPLDTSLVVRALAQLATDELLPSEQLGAGSLDSVRGYDPRVANGTQGIVLSTNAQPTFAIFHQISDESVTDQAQVLAFWIMGRVSYKHQQVTAAECGAAKHRHRQPLQCRAVFQSAPRLWLAVGKGARRHQAGQSGQCRGHLFLLRVPGLPGA